MMATHLHDKLRPVGSRRRKAIEARFRTQMSMASKLGISQDGVSRLEKRSNLMLSTLRRYIEAKARNS